MIAHWGVWLSRRGKSKEKMVYYCMQVGGGKQIRRDHLYWPVFGSFEDWICQALNIYVNSKEPFSLEESEYASLWIRSDTMIHVFTLREKNSKKKTKSPEELPLSPPPYILPAPSPDPTPPTSSPPSAPVPDHASPPPSPIIQEGLYPLKGDGDGMSAARDGVCISSPELPPGSV